MTAHPDPLPHLTVLVGNPKRNSRTMRAALTLGDQIAHRHLGDYVGHVVDLAELAPHVFDLRSHARVEAERTVCDSDVVIVASPTLAGSFSGLLKAFFDQFPPNGLEGVAAIPLVTGPAVNTRASESLRDLLVELGASCPTRSVQVADAQIDDLELTLPAWVAREGRVLSSLFSAPREHHRTALAS